MAKTAQATPLSARMIALCRWIAESETPPSLAELAAHAEVSPAHLHRQFKALTGLTPSAYAKAHRAERMRVKLSAQTAVTEAIYTAGYPAPSRFYAEAAQILGMRPSRYRKGGAHETIRFAVGECSLGAILVAHSTLGICAILLGDDPSALTHDLQDRFPAATLVGDDDSFASHIAQVIGLVEAPQIGLHLPLDIRGTAFQQRVWQALRDIPVGTKLSYRALAQQIGMPKAVRAVATACAANPLAVAIPCHRVVRTDGSLSGYRWGVERKQALLEKEAETLRSASMKKPG